MNKEIFFRGYETPVAALIDVTAEGMLCGSLSAGLETYDCIDEQEW